MTDNQKAKLRKAIYGVAVAVAAVLVGYGVITETEALLWLALFGAVSGLAFFNVDTDLPGGNAEG